MGDRLKALNREEIVDLVAVARREKAASLWIRDGLHANLYTGELERVHIALAGKRIAYVGTKEPMVDEDTQIIEAKDFTLVPGYIEPHAHPFQLYHPLTLANYGLTKGTTMYIGDNLFFYNHLTQNNWFALIEELSKHPVKILWWSRLDPQSEKSEVEEKYLPQALQANLEHPLVLQAGELTNWVSLFQGDQEMAERMALVKKVGKRIEGHAPGASSETLNALTAAGVTSDHEAIHGEEVMRRLRLGLYVPLRHSSIRPDLPILLQEIRELKYGWERLMLTTDGSTPPFIADGCNDHLIRVALENGIEPITAYRMATLNVATYYGIDEQIGGIAPGRLADILFLNDLHQPTPVKVMVEGEVVLDKTYEGIQAVITSDMNISWEAYGLGFQSKPHDTIDPELFQISWEDGKPFPVVHLINDVITVQKDILFPVKNGDLQVKEEGILRTALMDRERRWITKGLLSGFAIHLDALATTYTASSDILVIGRDIDAMANAVTYVLEHSGMAIVDEGKVINHLPLPIGGGMSDLGMEELIQKCGLFKDTLNQKGYRFEDPFYCLLFLTSTHLPKLRLTEKGIVSIKEDRIVLPSQRI